ncbi:hypothetical protein Theco_3976 (plasmid) [Thermobacillus composti KWC4]|uniref:Uncharacterized protein n=1 Tax=Thermobacillus composti (strain DSM 18247 / JCM 13945 / KWC4) TaxID=717605 RepID=L0EL16_THECK|nr:hypothetical protein [Thermobacillus composti]AGA59980.1 hypothetical protein Theco_3976 [Thermobacillus composti KWC4]
MSMVTYWNDEKSMMSPIEDIRLSEMEENILYSVEVKRVDWLGECKLKKWADCLSVSFVLFDEKGKLSENSEVQTIVFRLALLDELKRIDKPDKCIEDIVAYLRAFPNLAAYHLSDFSEFVAPHIYDIVYFNKLRIYDHKHGTFLRSLVRAFPAPDLTQFQNVYQLMVKEVGNHIEREKVTVMWALREFEKRYGWTAIEVLLDAEKSWDDFTGDIALQLAI